MLKCLNHAILIVHENKQEIYKHYVQVSLDGYGVAKRYQMHLWRNTWQNLTTISTCQNIRLMQACIYYGYYKISSKGQWITTIHHSLLS